MEVILFQNASKTGPGPYGRKSVLATSPKVLTVIYGTEPTVGSRCPWQLGIAPAAYCTHLVDVVLIAEDTYQSTRNVYTGDRLPVSLKAC